jgi:chromosome segregation ATPase
MSEAQVVDAVSEPKTASTVVTSENLAEFNANKLGLATEPSPTAADTVDDKSGSEPAAKDGQSEPGLADKEATGTEDKKQNPKLEKRFSELTKQRKEAEARAEELARRVAELENQREPAKAEYQGNREPQPDDFKDAFDYAKELAKWSAEQALAKREQEVKQKEVEAQRETVIKTWQQKLESTKAELPDYEDMVASSTVSVNDTVRDAIIESDVGPRILYELASDDDLAEKLTSMSTASALKMIGKLEAKFEKTAEPVKAEKKTVAAKSNAPEPIRPLRSTGGVSDVALDSDNLSYQQWKAARKAGKIR